jgi:glycosyltransferase involved in cell wall biosynthesis
VTEPGDDRVVYLGWLSEARGVREAVEVGRLLQPYGVAVELIGYADPQSRPLLSEAVAEGVLEWRDFMPNDEALKRLDGALAGLSLLHDEPNYRHSMPTKIVEYMAHGIPVITTPSPRAVELIERYQSGVVVPWQDPKAVAQAVLQLRDDTRERLAQGARGYAAARANHHWPTSAQRFVTQLEAWGGVQNDA